MQYLKAEFEEILKKHKMWLNDEDGGEKADLRGSNLRGSNLRGSNLRGSNLRGSNLRGSNLSGSNLRGSNLRGSNLRDCDLSDCDLSDCDLSGSNLRGSNLRGSNLRGCDLSGSNLRGCDLDFSMLSFSCNSLQAKFGNKHIVQILYHAAMPTQHNALDIDDDVKELFNSDLFKQVVNKFHRVEECGVFIGIRDSE